MAAHRLPFEQEIAVMEDALARLEAGTESALGGGDELRRLRRELTSLTKRIFSNLTPWQVVQVSRHHDRPKGLDYVNLLFENFTELHGDRTFGDDRAIRTGFARLGDYKVLLVVQHKGRNL